jgi:hypothetical protein
MKFFTKELWLGAQKVSQFKDIHPQYQEAEKAYRAQLNTLRRRLSQEYPSGKHTVDGGREASLEIVRPVSASGSKLWV